MCKCRLYIKNKNFRVIGVCSALYENHVQNSSRIHLFFPSLKQQKNVCLEKSKKKILLMFQRGKKGNGLAG